MTAIYRALYIDLRDRGGLDLQIAYQDGAFRLQREGLELNLVVDPHFHGTWQLSTAMLFIAWMSRLLKSNPRRSPSASSDFSF